MDFVKYRNGSCTDSGCDRYRRKVRLQEITSADAARLCRSDGWKSVTDRGSGEYDRTVSFRAARFVLWLFEYAVVGLPILIAGILFYATIGFRILPNHDTEEDDSIFDETQDFGSVPKWKKYYHS